ncbi:sensor histidine kinase [Segetibacter koreensis]|uniref:sensor histidine kinase n=1 Tax=Segetibacter koreensis TaxID=398037 RepID=UPI00036C3E86|nr:ATP-binding protein [Segetibacter koreensis]
MEAKTYEELVNEVNDLRLQLEEANDTIDAIRTGKVDALVVKGKKGHELYTLKTADQTYRLFIEKMIEGAVTLDQHGIILYSNSQFALMVNMPLSKVIGLSFSNFIDPASKQQFSSLFKRGWKEDCKGEIVLVHEGKNREFQLSFTSLELDEGVSLSIILTDLTEQKENQRQLKLNNKKLEEINCALETSNHDLQQFASVASHDLQEPLRKIQIYSNLLQEKHLAELTPSASLYLHKIVASTERMRVLIHDILSFSRLSANDIKYELTDLKSLTEELLKDFEILVEEKKATIIIGDLPMIEVNPGQIRQVLQNIISNAIKFSRQDVSPEIHISGTRICDNLYDSDPLTDGPYACIRIKDNGIGFDEKYMSNVFTLFKRLHPKDKYEGTGIGLAIAKRIIEKHNGNITARSTEGVGSEFIIVLPVHQQQVV